MLEDILAGIISGLIMGTFFLSAGVYILMTNPDIYDRLAKRFHENMSPTLVMLSMVITIPPVCGLIGGLAGLLYNAIKESRPAGGLGSPNLTFTLIVLSIFALVTVGLVFARRHKLWRLGFLLNLIFAAIFGWLLPALANWR